LNIIENNDDINQNTLQKLFNEYKEKEIVHYNMNDNLKYSIELLALLKNSNVSDALYDKLVAWLSSCENVDAHCSLPKRDTVMKQLSQCYMMDALYPEQKRCVLSSINLPIYVPIHSFVISLYTLLTATDLMKAQNLLFANTANPCYIPPRNMTTPLGDINTGNAYYNYYEQTNLMDNDVIIPFMLFADGMQIDKNGHTCQEPWMYTLGIFKQHIQNQPRAWRNIGLTKLNAYNMYTNNEVWQSKKDL